MWSVTVELWNIEMMGLIHLNKFPYRAANDKNDGVIRPYPQNSIFPAFHYSIRNGSVRKNAVSQKQN